MMYSTTAFDASLINAILGYMLENRVSRMPFEFLASGKNGFPETSKLAKMFIENGNYEYFFVKNGKLFLHKNPHGKYGLSEYDCEVVAVPRSLNEDRAAGCVSICICTSDLVNLVRIVYDTVGNYNFPHNVEVFDTAEIDELEAEYEARRNECA